MLSTTGGSLPVSGHLSDPALALGRVYTFLSFVTERLLFKNSPLLCAAASSSHSAQPDTSEADTEVKNANCTRTGTGSYGNQTSSFRDDKLGMLRLLEVEEKIKPKFLSFVGY